jgi:uncharacterized membrane protein
VPVGVVEAGPVAPRVSHAGLPRLGAVVARTAASLAVAVLVPAVVLAATLLLVNLTAALIGALSWMVAVMAWRWATGRAVSMLLVLALVMLAIKTAFTLATGNTFVYFLQPVVTDTALALVFLGSLWIGLPVVARLAPDFYPVDAEIAARPRVRRLYRQLTALWGVVLIAKGAITLWLLLSLSLVDFVVIKGGAITALSAVAAGATIAWAAVVGRREGLLQLRTA